MFSSLWGFALLSLALPHTAVASSHHGLSNRRHEAIAHAINNVTEAAEGEVAALQRRGTTYTNARLTYYDVGLGACGKNNVPSDFIVALNSGMYGGGYPGPNCFRPIAITYNGKTANAVIMDECPGCPSDGGLDLSEGLFSYLAPLSEGVLYATWHFTDEGDDGNSGGSQPTTTTTHKTTHTTTSSTWKWTPTTTWEAPTTTWEAPTTTSTTKSTHSTTTTTTSTYSSTHSTTSSKPTTTSQSSTSTSSTSSFSSSSSHSSSSSSAAPTVTQVGSIEKLNQAFVGIVDLMIGAAQAA